MQSCNMTNSTLPGMDGRWSRVHVRRTDCHCSASSPRQTDASPEVHGYSGMPQQPSKATTSKGRAMGITDRAWYFHVWLSLLISLTSSATALAALLTPAPATTRVLDVEDNETRQEQGLVETEDPRAILAQAQRWRERGAPFP